MLDLHKPPPSTDTKTYFSHSALPAYIDALHTSAKKKPFATFLAHPHSHTLDLVLPAELWELVEAHLAARDAVYARACMTLANVLDEPFADAYARTGRTSLLSEGRADANMRFQVDDGVLRIDMHRSAYERAGLVGVPLADGGKKHASARWRVECDLKLASMRAGNKGFERLRWAAREVLTDSLAVVFCSANPGFAESVRDGREVLSLHAPRLVRLQPNVAALRGVVVPRLDAPSALHGQGEALYGQGEALALLEWLDLLSLGSARVRAGSAEVDGHLCRYDVPDFGRGVETRDLVRVRWRGFITPAFIKDVFLHVWAAAKGPRAATAGPADHADAWFSMSAQAFGGNNGWSLMQFANRETLVWEVEG
ncbi:uncharacterized protein M421DRAFT_99510 [Didymella exigua CBS 183.55]|uniref:Uncharacterized protein n=1 Tax=Didymella exigua CBS 183.55 TaxID=1150837 RepID=A0A6A5RUA4_9PLEO|nr:uncharacterized protein M421DRAFT_99510 [Didymella exigua CBS 183.55]KAF1930950.1 hypothetical protein M421DRAFT_99510 [Didymella exigua CBS 183.55]